MLFLWSKIWAYRVCRIWGSFSFSWAMTSGSLSSCSFWRSCSFYFRYFSRPDSSGGKFILQLLICNSWYLMTRLSSSSTLALWSGMMGLFCSSMIMNWSMSWGCTSWFKLNSTRMLLILFWICVIYSSISCFVRCWSSNWEAAWSISTCLDSSRIWLFSP